jgi:hypothetical protein
MSITVEPETLIEFTYAFAPLEVTADAGGPYTLYDFSSIDLVATGSGGATLTYAWDLDEDGTFERDGDRITVSSGDFSAHGDYTVSVQVCNVLDTCATDTTTITFAPVPLGSPNGASVIVFAQHADGTPIFDVCFRLTGEASELPPDPYGEWPSAFDQAECDVSSSESDGATVFAGPIGPGTYTLTVDNGGTVLPGWSQQITIDPDDAVVEVPVIWPSVPAMVITLETADGTPLDGFCASFNGQMACEYEDREDFEVEIYLQSAGQIDLTSVSKWGQWEVDFEPESLSWDGFTTITRNFVATPTGVTTLVLNVVDANGDPVTGGGFSMTSSTGESLDSAQDYVDGLDGIHRFSYFQPQESTTVTITQSSPTMGFEYAAPFTVEIRPGEVTTREVELVPLDKLVIVRVEDTNGNLVPGGCFTIRNHANPNQYALGYIVCDGTLGDPRDGTFTFFNWWAPQDLEPGTYLLMPEENLLVTPSGPAQEFTWAEGGAPQTLVFTVPDDALHLEFVDQNGSSAPGGCVTLTAWSGEQVYLPSRCDAFDGRMDGIITYYQLPSGAYSIVETAAPVGLGRAATEAFYLGDNRPQTVTIEHTGAPNTPTGSDVLVEGLAGGSVSVRFPTVTTAGNTAASVVDPADLEPLPIGYHTSNALYFDLATDAIFSSPAEVCITFDPTSFFRPRGAQVVQLVGTTWTPIWDSAHSENLPNGVACGFAATLSPIAVAEAIPQYGDAIVHVQGADGEPATSGWYQFFTAEGCEDPEAQVGMVPLNGDGNAELMDFPPGDYCVTEASAPSGYSGIDEPVKYFTIVAGQVTTVTFTYSIFDSDLDGLNNDVDNCDNYANPDQSDIDGDGLGDACESLPEDDMDGDGVSNDIDNCPDVVNSGQENRDSIGPGDACSPTWIDLNPDAGVAIMFPAGTTFGATTASQIADLGDYPDLPEDRLTGNALMYEIGTTNQFTGDLYVCITFPEGHFEVRENIDLYQLVEDSWVSITENRWYTDVCGYATSVGVFLAAESGTDPSGVPIGSPVTVSPDGFPHITLTFQEVTQAGDLTASVIANPLALGQFIPAQGGLGDQNMSTALAWELATDAVYSGAVQVCITYDSSQFTDFGDIQLAALFENGSTNWWTLDTAQYPTDQEVCASLPQGIGPVMIVQALTSVMSVDMWNWALPPTVSVLGNDDVDGCVTFETTRVCDATDLGGENGRIEFRGPAGSYVLTQFEPPAGFVPVGSLEGFTLSSCSGCGSNSVSFPLTPVNTSAGSSVSITVPGPGGVTATFASVSDAGATWSNGPFGPETAPPLPGGYSTVTAKIYEISTTSLFTGPVELCVTYDPSGFADPSTIRLFAEEAGSWIDVTTSNAGDVVCGSVSALGTFTVAGIGEPLHTLTLELRDLLAETAIEGRGGCIHLLHSATGTPFDGCEDGSGFIRVQVYPGLLTVTGYDPPTGYELLAWSLNPEIGMPNGPYGFEIYHEALPPNTVESTEPVVVEPAGGPEEAMITFPNVLTPGYTSIQSLGSPPDPAGNFQLGDATFYDIQTTATFDGVAQVCLPSSDPQDRLWHYDGDGWVDVTDAGYPSGGLICGSVTDFSPFAVAPAATEAMTIVGFSAPVDMDGTVNTVKGGSTVPLRFEVFQGDVEITDTAAIASFTVTKMNCESGADEAPVEFTASGGTNLRYAGGMFQQNWKTPKSTGCYKVVVTTIDGATLEAYFRLK